MSKISIQDILIHVCLIDLIKNSNFSKGLCPSDLENWQNKQKQTKYGDEGKERMAPWIVLLIPKE